MIASAVVSFFSVWLLSHYLSAQTKRRMVGYMGFYDLALHGFIMYAFWGTENMIQAEAAACMFSISFRMAKYLYGYERKIIPGEDPEKPYTGVVRYWKLLTEGQWQRFAGRLT